MSVFAESVGPTPTKLGRADQRRPQHGAGISTLVERSVDSWAGAGGAAPRRTGHCVSPLAAPPPLPSDSVIREFRGSNHGPAAALRGYAGILLAEREGDKQRILSAFTLLSINDTFKRILVYFRQEAKQI